ncbi:hypothetical protein L1049_012926 [Liquidambar formosana]|uniref:Uncharacterized protein n=1 Tax=Liquidambar formosana TaxID=63359 RepID=A0AAP0WX58_LIQFO
MIRVGPETRVCGEEEEEEEDGCEAFLRESVGGGGLEGATARPGVLSRAKPSSKDTELFAFDLANDEFEFEFELRNGTPRHHHDGEPISGMGKLIQFSFPKRDVFTLCAAVGRVFYVFGGGAETFSHKNKGYRMICHRMEPIPVVLDGKFYVMGDTNDGVNQKC